MDADGSHGTCQETGANLNIQKTFKSEGSRANARLPSFTLHKNIQNKTSLIYERKTMLSFVFILAIASFSLEMMIASKFPAMRRIASSNNLANLAISIALSYFIGVMFGAAGLIAMTAGIVSTLMSVPGYAMLHQIYDSEKAQERGGNQIEYYKQKTAESRQKWSILAKDLAKVTYTTGKVITAPVWITRNVYVKGKNIASKFNRNNNHN